MQDDVDAPEAVLSHVFGNGFDRPADHVGTHLLRQLPPRGICHFIDITVRTRQIATRVHFDDKLLEWDSLMSRCPDFRHVQVE